MHTEKDFAIVDWIGRLGAAGAEHVTERFAMGRRWAYARLSKLVLGGLLEQRTVLYRRPGLYIAMAEALRWCANERSGVYHVGRPGRFRARSPFRLDSDRRVPLAQMLATATVSDLVRSFRAKRIPFLARPYYEGATVPDTA